MRKLTLLVLAILFAGLAQAQSFNQVFGHTQVSATGYYNPAGSDATRNSNGCSDWLSRSPGNGGCYITGLYHLGQDMLVSSPTYTNGTPNGVGHSVYAIADGVVNYVSKGTSGHSSATPGYFSQTSYVSTALANWGTTKCDTIKSLTQYEDPNCGTGIRKYNVSVLVKHKRAGSNAYFWGIYGHIIDYNLITGKPFQIGDTFTAGQAFTLIGDWEDGIHLHFGIFVPNTSTDFPSIPMTGQKFGLANDTDCKRRDSTQQKYISCAKIDWKSDGPTTFGLADPIVWLTTVSNAPDNYISAAGTSSTNPKVIQTSVPSSVTIPQGGVGEVPFNLQSILGFSGSAQGNAITTPTSLLSLSGDNKILAANETVPTTSLLHIPSYTPIGTYTAKVQTVFKDNNGNTGATPQSTVTLQAVAPFIGGGSGATELFATSLYSDPSLVSYWRFEGNSNDNKGSSNGTGSGIIYGTSYGKFGQGASFNSSTSSRISATMNGFPIGNAARTVSAWVYPINLSTSLFSTVFSYGQNAPHQINQLSVFWDSGVGKWIAVYDTWSESAWAATNIQMNQWYLLTATFDGSTIRLYLNGSQIATGSASFINTPPSGDARMGVQAGGTGNPWNGYLDDVAVFSRALSAAEVAGLYNDSATSTPAISSVGTSGGMTTNSSFKVYAAASSVDPVNVQAVIYGSGCPNGCTGTKNDATTTSYVGSFTAPSQAGTYQLQLRNGMSGPLSNSKNLTIYSPLSATCTPNGSNLAVNTAITYTASVSGGLSPYSISWDNGAVGTGTTVTTTYTNGGYLAGVDLYITDYLGNQIRTTCVNQIQLGTPSITAFGVTSTSAIAGVPFDGILSGFNFNQATGGLQVWFCPSGGGTCYQQPAGISVTADIEGSQAVVTSINLSAGTWVVKVRNGSTGTWSNLSNSFTVASAPSGPAEFFSTSLFSDPGLRAYYRLESNVNDSTANGYHGTPSSISYVSGKFGQSVALSPSFSSNVKMVTYPAYTANSPVSFNAWIYLNAYGTLGYHGIANSLNGSANGWALYHTDSGNLASYTNAHRIGSRTIPLVTWTMATFVFTGSRAKIYLNGTLERDDVASTTSSGKPLRLSYFYYDADQGSSIGFFDGRIDDVSVFSRALTDAEISSLYGGGGSSTTGTIAVSISGYSGNVSCTLNGNAITAPTTLNNQVNGNYTLSCTAPTGYTLSSISPSATQALSGGGTTTFTVNLTANPSPLTGSCTVNGQNSPLALQVGNQATYAITASGGTGTKHYTWYNISGNDSNSALQIYNSAGTYNVYTVVSDSAQTPQQITVNCPQVTVQSPPPISAYCSFSPSTIILGNGSTMTAGAIGGTSPYTFLLPGSGSFVSNNTTLIVPTSTGTLAYYVTVKDTQNQTNTASCQITVN